MKGVAVVFSINVKVKKQHDPHVATTGISFFEMNYLELSERFLSILQSGNSYSALLKNINFSINIWSNLNSNGIFGQLVKFCVQNCPWMLNLIKNEGSYEGFNVEMCPFFLPLLKISVDIQFIPFFLFCFVTASNLVNSLKVYQF